MLGLFKAKVQLKRNELTKYIINYRPSIDLGEAIHKNKQK